MKFLKKLAFLALAITTLGTSTSGLKADDCCYDNNPCCVDTSGCGYDQCCNTGSMAPAIALGAIAVVAIVAVAAQGSSSHHHHSHSH